MATLKPSKRPLSPGGYRSQVITPKQYATCPGNGIRHQPTAIAYRQGRNCCFFGCPFCGNRVFLRHPDWSTSGLSADAAIAQGLYLIDSV